MNEAELRAHRDHAADHKARSKEEARTARQQEKDLERLRKRAESDPDFAALLRVLGR